MSDNLKKKALGRGLSAFFDPKESGDYQEINLENISVGRYQPRKVFEENGLEELSASIKEKGVLQPLLVRRKQEEGFFELIAGERRFRAAKLAELEEVPCRILDFSDEEALEAGLLENIQREDLSCLEEAFGYLRLIEDFSYTQETLAKKIGKSRSYVANTLRLLNLPEEVRLLLEGGKITAGHARALINSKDPIKFAQLIIARGLNVRRTEELVRQDDDAVSAPFIPEDKGQEEVALAQQLAELTGLNVKISLKKVGGTIQFFFKGPLELDRFLAYLTQGYAKNT